MIGLMISAAEIRSAPLAVRIWLEQRSLWISGKSLAIDRLSADPAFQTRAEPEQQSEVATEPESAVPTPIPDENPLPANNAEAQAQEQALHKLIAERAYEIWESQGRPQGYDLVHWHEAEQEIMDCIKDAAQVVADPYIAQPTTA
jgi:hypothetical protein